MPTSRFVELVGIPERTWRRWQQRDREGRPPKGPWPAPVRAAHREVIVELATRHPAWGHRKIWAMARHNGYRISQRSVARLLDAEGLLLKQDYQRERREPAKARKAAFELALDEAQRLLGPVPLVEHLTDPDTGEIVPITSVTDNGGPFRSSRFAALITARPELRHVRTRVRSPGQNGVRERAFGSLKYERLYREQIDDPLDLFREADAYRTEFNQIRPHEALSWHRPFDVHIGRADPRTLNFLEPKTLPTP